MDGTPTECPQAILTLLDEPKHYTLAPQWRKLCGDRRVWPADISELFANGINYERDMGQLAEELIDLLRESGMSPAKQQDQ